MTEKACGRDMLAEALIKYADPVELEIDGLPIIVTSAAKRLTYVDSNLRETVELVLDDCSDPSTAHFPINAVTTRDGWKSYSSFAEMFFASIKSTTQTATSIDVPFVAATSDDQFDVVTLLYGSNFDGGRRVFGRVDPACDLEPFNLVVGQDVIKQQLNELSAKDKDALLARMLLNYVLAYSLEGSRFHIRRVKKDFVVMTNASAERRVDVITLSAAKAVKFDEAKLKDIIAVKDDEIWKLHHTRRLL
jgi:hypothetical protein